MSEYNIPRLFKAKNFIPDPLATWRTDAHYSSGHPFPFRGDQPHRFLFTVVQVQQEKERMTVDLERRASILGEGLKESLEPLFAKGQVQRLQALVEKFGNRERLAGVAVYDAQDKLVAATSRLAPYLKNAPPLVGNVMSNGLEEGIFLPLGGRKCTSMGSPDSRRKGRRAMVMVYETKQIQDRVALIWENNFIRLLVSALFIF